MCGCRLALGPYPDRTIGAMSTLTTERRSTLQDQATLPLHPDGSRIKLRSPKRRDPFHKAGRNARGNRVARVPKRPAPLKDGRVETISSGPDVSLGESRRAKPRQNNRRKRRRLDSHDVEFLRDSGNVPGNADVVRETRWPVPSSDLLKCVNYFACQYYTARGLLLDQSCEYSREKGQRKADDRHKVRASGNGDSPIVADGGNDENAKKEECEGAEVSSKGLPGMYKAFDGSALVAIGMLLQELVSTLLKPNVPPGWEKEMEAAGLVPDDESVGSEDGRTEEIQSNNSADEEIYSKPGIGRAYKSIHRRSTERYGRESACPCIKNLGVYWCQSHLRRKRSHE
ncbi:hypothetical protein EDB87DRAFT_1828554 [Lactarius vividus]|nr:hypothetical protein EDB87DRAFT_1828554 [Lactarius vividus]